MLYRMTFRSNPKLFIVPLVIVVLLALGLSAFAVGPLLGIGGIVLAAYIAFILVRFVDKQLKCTIETGEETVAFDLYGEEKIRFGWTEVSHMGVATDHRRRRMLFLYRAEEDKLLVAPDEFERFDALVAEASAHGRLLEVALEGTETLKERLRALVGTSPEDEEEEDGEEEDGEEEDGEEEDGEEEERDRDPAAPRPPPPR